MRKKDIIFCIILLMLQFIPTACRDDYFMNEEIGEGNATLSVTLCFDQEDAALGTTRAEGGDEGNAIQNINSLCMLFYDTLCALPLFKNRIREVLNRCNSPLLKVRPI